MLKHEDEIVVRIKNRIALTKLCIARRNANEDTLDEWDEGYNTGKTDAEEEELNFLVQLLTDFVRV